MNVRIREHGKKALFAAIGLAFWLPFSASAQNAGIEASVRAAFADAPVMIAVAKCESGYRQFASEGVVLRGGSGKGYIGVFQIGERLHAAPAAAAGYDIYTVEGNIGYARKMYDAQGSTPWRECVPAAPVIKDSVIAQASEGALTANLVLGSRNEQVRMLQRLLNAKGFTVAAAGAGSPGNETTTFGSLTREALRRFQCSKGIACDGNESTTGYGRLGPKTRAALNE